MRRTKPSRWAMKLSEDSIRAPVISCWNLAPKNWREIARIWECDFANGKNSISPQKSAFVFFAYDIERSLKTTKGAKTWGTPSQQINISLQSRALIQRFLLQCELNQIYIAQIKALSGKNLWLQIRNPFQSTTLKWMKTHSVYIFSIKKGDMRCFWFFLFFVYVAEIKSSH